MIKDAIDVRDLPKLIRLMLRENGNQFHLQGNPISIYVSHGLYCVRYANGHTTHYDLISNEYF